MNRTTETSSLDPKEIKRGLINPKKVRMVTFGVITTSIAISVITCILAIWDFTQQDTLWRTVATCLVIIAGMIAFGVTNSMYGDHSEA
ncbi:MAG: hypothetical protein M5U15_04230 [Kiritimatiellae bacterium]|nr:hypothetical protein [Kiritimatiellia bacterium]